MASPGIGGARKSMWKNLPPYQPNARRFLERRDAIRRPVPVGLTVGDTLMPTPRIRSAVDGEVAVAEPLGRQIHRSRAHDRQRVQLAGDVAVREPGDADAAVDRFMAEPGHVSTGGPLVGVAHNPIPRMRLDEPSRSPCTGESRDLRSNPVCPPVFHTGVRRVSAAPRPSCAMTPFPRSPRRATERARSGEARSYASGAGGARTSRLPTWLAAPTTPSRSICSIMEAARL